MYLYIALSEDQVQSKQYRFWGDFFETIKRNFPSYRDLNSVGISECIGFYRKKEDGEKPAFRLFVKMITIKDREMIIYFDVGQHLDLSSKTISREIYKFGKLEGWYFHQEKFYPNLCILDKAAFDSIRKATANARKIYNALANLEELRSNNNWEEICSIYEPLEDLHNKQNIWNNSDELYNIAYACSKMGEPKNGLEQDKNHLTRIKRYRELSIKFYSRCIELEPSDRKYVSALGYRYYLNVLELTRTKGRSDGDVSDELAYS